MQIHIHIEDESVREPLEEFTERKLQDALRHLSDRLTRVDIRLRDLNGGKAGIDKRCTIEARPRGLDPMAVEHDAEDFTEAASQAIAKIKRALQSKFDRLGSRKG